MRNNASGLMQATQILLEGGLLNGVEISANPLRMEDEVIDGDRMDYYMAIIKKLCWEDMLLHISLPAIDKMHENFNYCMYEATLEIFSLEEFVACVLSWTNHTSDEIFKYLYVDEIFKDDSEDCYLFVSLRGKIEEYMHRGYSYQDAIDKWFK
jgi:hypothetical protein